MCSGTRAIVTFATLQSGARMAVLGRRKKSGYSMGVTNTDRTYDAIVIGSGATGGWAAKELCDHGLKTLMLERGRNVEHVKDYPTASKGPWEFEHRGTVSIEAAKNLQGAKNLREVTLHWALKDDEQPF